jgi:fatty acid amide hydrolase 2
MHTDTHAERSPRPRPSLSLCGPLRADGCSMAAWQECIAVKGMPQTAGFVPRTFTHAVAEADATVVQRLRQAGCVILGVTNTSELCFFSECNNHVYGRSLNPYDPTRTTGGSSGGEGGIIGAVRTAPTLGHRRQRVCVCACGWACVRTSM